MLKMTKLKQNKLNRFLYLYRFDIFSLFFMLIIILWFLSPLLSKGHIVFSDLDFPENSRRYMEEIFGIWNERWNTSTMLNLPRLLYTIIPWLISALFDYDGSIFLKSYIILIIWMSAFSMFLFCKRLVSIYKGKDFNFHQIFALIGGALFYALNPWVILRIQHLYLLCGYSLLPLFLLFLFNLFDPRFQKQLIPKYSPFRIRLYSRNIIDILLLALVMTMMSAAIHYFFYSLIFLGVLFFLLLGKTFIKHFQAGRKQRRAIIYNFLLKGAVLSLFILLFSYYWLSVYAGSILADAQASQNNINVIDTLSLFSRNSGPVNVLYLISYWWPMFDLSTLNIFFYLGGGIIILCIILGITANIRKNNILFFLLLLTLGFLFTATGTKLDFFAEAFVFLVNNIPIFGTIFRDPNKLIGLAALGYGVLFTFGVEFLFSLKTKTRSFTYLRNAMITVILLASLWLYISPFHHHFMEGYYKPVEVPAEYDDINNRFTENSVNTGRVLYFPIADNMIQPHTGVATPYWNQNPNKTGLFKATGDFPVYNSMADTLFHHEGNPPALTYYLNYLQNMLDFGQTQQLGTYLSALPVSKLAYVSGYLGQEGRQNFNTQILALQNDLNQEYSNNLFSLFTWDQTNREMIRETGTIIHTPYGLDHISALARLPEFTFNSHGFIFSSINTASYIHNIRPGDYIEGANFNDLWLSNLPEDMYLFPAKAVNQGNAFLSWAQSAAHTNDWLWYLRSQNITNFPFDFTFNGGIAVSFASSKLDIPPYKREHIRGELVMDFNAMLRLDLFFKPDNPQLFSIAAYPLEKNNPYPLLHGEILRGDPKGIWQVAKSGLLEAKENNPYQFKILMSGRGTNKIHIKVRFFDENSDELGISYVVAPSEEIDFEGLTFYGEYVSPPGARYMRLELLSYQRPEQKVYWWIHDIEVLDLEKYKSPNSFNLTFQSDKERRVSIYARLFKNKIGGTIRFTINGKDRDIVTGDSSINQFQWVPLGSYPASQGDNTITVENKGGFNALNMLAVIPENHYESSRFPIRQAINKGKLFAAFEGENDFTYTGSIQSERTYPRLSLGKGISSPDGLLTRELEIMKNGLYSFGISGAGQNSTTGIIFTLEDSSGTPLFQKTLTFPAIPSEKPPEVVEFAPFDLERPYSRFIKPHPGGLPNYQLLEIPPVIITKGQYRMSLKLQSSLSSLSTIQDLRKFIPQEVKIPDFLEDIYQVDCSDCETITLDMMDSTISANRITLEFEPTCSCDWYVYSTSKMAVIPGDEYLVRFNARSMNLEQRHTKILFLDKENRIIKTNFVPEVEEMKKNEWNRYEHIVKTPEDAAKMLFQIWGRGDKITRGRFDMEDFSILPYKELPMVDLVYLTEGRSIKDFFSPLHPPARRPPTPELVRKLDAMKYTFSVDNPENREIILNTGLIPNPLWQFTTEHEQQRGRLQFNSLTTAIITTANGEMEAAVILRDHYYFGLWLLPLGVLLAFLFYKNARNPVNLRRRLLRIWTKMPWNTPGK